LQFAQKVGLFFSTSAVMEEGTTAVHGEGEGTLRVTSRVLLHGGRASRSAAHPSSRGSGENIITRKTF
jgi:hypothetical protein